MMDFLPDLGLLGNGRVKDGTKGTLIVPLDPNQQILIHHLTTISRDMTFF